MTRLIVTTHFHINGTVGGTLLGYGIGLTTHLLTIDKTNNISRLQILLIEPRVLTKQFDQLCEFKLSVSHVYSE